MKIVTTGGQAEIVEKKSRFIAQVFPVQTSEEAYADLAAVRKQYWDARHSCHAFVIGPNNETAHSSDDGEPQGTAGKPILQVLTGSEIRDCLIVVTRYFGGVLLGTGGLVRAYTQAAKAGLDASEISSRQDGWLLTIRCSYEQLGKVQYLIGASSCPVTATYGRLRHGGSDSCRTAAAPESRPDRENSRESFLSEGNKRTICHIG